MGGDTAQDGADERGVVGGVVGNEADVAEFEADGSMAGRQDPLGDLVRFPSLDVPGRDAESDSVDEPVECDVRGRTRGIGGVQARYREVEHQPVHRWVGQREGTVVGAARGDGAQRMITVGCHGDRGGKLGEALLEQGVKMPSLDPKRLYTPIGATLALVAMSRMASASGPRSSRSSRAARSSASRTSRVGVRCLLIWTFSGWGAVTGRGVADADARRSAVLGRPRRGGMKPCNHGRNNRLGVLVPHEMSVAAGH